MKQSEYNRQWSAGDLEIGDQAPPLIVEDVDREDFVKYAGASGDFNRIHYDEPFAKQQGNPSVFGQGMLTAGFVSHLLTRWIGLKYVRTFRTRFEDRVWPGDTLRITGEITDRESVEDGDRLTVELDASNQDNETVLSGEAVVHLPPR